MLFKPHPKLTKGLIANISKLLLKK